MSREVSERKVRTYLLNITHRVGGPKARFFLACGFTDGAWQILAEALRRHILDNPIESEEQIDFGLKVVVRCHLNTPDGSNPCIRTVWMVETGAPARLVTAYPFRS